MQPPKYALCATSAAAIEDKKSQGDDEDAVGEMFRLQSNRQNEENHRSQFQLRQNGRIGNEHRGDATTGAYSAQFTGMRKR